MKRAWGGPAAAALAVLTGACSSPPKAPAPIDAGLPFHVLLVGLEEASLRPSSLPSGADSTDMLVDLSADQVAEALTSELESEAFVRISRAPAGLDPLKVARAERADLILDCRLEYERDVWRRRNVSTSVSWLLFIVGGPFVTNLRDWEYGIDAELSGGLYDVSRMDGALVRLGDPRARVATVEADFGTLPLNFNERRKGDSSFWRALLIPSHLLAKQNPKLEARLAAALAPRLSNALARRLAERQAAILAASPGGALSCASEDFDLKSEGPGQWSLSGAVMLLDNPRFDAPGELRLLVGERLWTARVDPAERVAGGQRFPFRFEFEANGQRYVRLELEAGARDLEQRSYCFDLERAALSAESSGSAVPASAPKSAQEAANRN